MVHSGFLTTQDNPTYFVMQELGFANRPLRPFSARAYGPYGTTEDCTGCCSISLCNTRTVTRDLDMTTPLRVLILEDRPADAELIAAELRRSGFDPGWQRVETEADYCAALDA